MSWRVGSLDKDLCSQSPSLLWFWDSGSALWWIARCFYTRKSLTSFQIDFFFSSAWVLNQGFIFIYFDITYGILFKLSFKKKVRHFQCFVKLHFVASVLCLEPWTLQHSPDHYGSSRGTRLTERVREPGRLLSPTNNREVMAMAPYTRPE